LQENTAGPVTITLEAVEFHYLLTVLRSSSHILHAITKLQETLPEALDLGIKLQAIDEIDALADRIEKHAVHS
jgi:hypothetical protein